jgi:hypothetical protein
MQTTILHMPSARRRNAALLCILVTLSVLLATLMPAGAATVEVKNGNIELVQDGQQRSLTKVGKDEDPVLSPDGKWVAFTRVNNRASKETALDCKSGALADELRRIRIDGTGEEFLLRGHYSSDPKNSLCDFSHKQYTSNGRYIFFLSPGWAVSGGLHRYDSVTKKRTFVIDANDVIVLNDCKNAANRDDLVVLQHRYFVVPGSFNWYWLFNRTGKTEKGPIGEYDTEKAVRDAIKGSIVCEPDGGRLR